jgi:4-oxalocrotonate tautomerase family enzyme
MGIETGVDVFKIQDVAEDLVVPIMDFPIRIDRDALTLGYAGVYGSFLLFAKRAEKKYGVPARDILVEMGRRGMVGGQEDMIEDTAMTMALFRRILMPFAQIYMIEGRTEEQKRAVIEKVSAALVEATGAPLANVRVWIHDVPKENWGIAGVSAKDMGR